MRPQRDDGEQGEESRGGAQDGFVGPLTLGLDTEVSADLRKSYLDLPAADEPGKNVMGMRIEIGRQECLRVEFATRIADQKPAYRNWLNAAAIPQRGAACDLVDAIGPAVPQADLVALPDDFAILEDGGKLFVGLAFDRPAAALPFALSWWEMEQVGIETQAGDDADMVADGSQEFDGRKGAVGDQDNVSIRQPAVDLQRGLASPIEQGFGRARLAGIEALGRSKQ